LETGVTEEKNKWYQQPMMWLVIAIPLSAVFVGAIMLTLSITTFDGLVEDDYYKKGKEINQLLARDEFAMSNGIRADVNIDDKTGVIVIDLKSTAKYEFPNNMGLSLLHPTRSKQDVKLLLTQGPDGRYYSELLRPLTPGRWYFRVSEPNWRLQKLISWPEGTVFTLNSDS
jgi:hypothetical protein